MTMNEDDDELSLDDHINQFVDRLEMVALDDGHVSYPSWWGPDAKRLLKTIVQQIKEEVKTEILKELRP